LRGCEQAESAARADAPVLDQQRAPPRRGPDGPHMRAWRIRRYGGPEVVALEEAPVPEPGPGEVLVRVAAASGNPSDWLLREGKLQKAFPVTFPRTLGRDCAGTIAAVGEGVADVPVGDEVFGVSAPDRDGTHAEFACLKATAVMRRPPALPMTAATTLGVAALSAYIPLVELAQLGAGERVLVHAGAGGVGHLAVQIARHLGAEVIATCSAANADFCRGLGAHRVIDYAREDFTDAARESDVVFDMLGGEVHARSAAALKPGGRLVYIIGAPIEPTARTDIRVLNGPIAATPERLRRIAEWADAGLLRPHVERVYPFEDAPAMYAASQQRHGRGKRVLAVGAAAS
jgi:NADPH:quinone reductase-like Zn-dependent oxidoreductase